MRDWKSVVGVLLVFVLGGIAGAFISLIVVHHRITTVLQRGSPAYEQLLEHRLSRGLHLTEDQRTHFHQALAANIAQRQALQKQLQPQIQIINGQTRRDFQAFLTPEQLATFRQNMQDFRKRFGSPGLGGRAVNADETPATNLGTATNAAPE